MNIPPQIRPTLPILQCPLPPLLHLLRTPISLLPRLAQIRQPAKHSANPNLREIRPLLHNAVRTNNILLHIY